jgi:hypothetical protein
MGQDRCRNPKPVPLSQSADQVGDVGKPGDDQYRETKKGYQEQHPAPGQVRLGICFAFTHESSYLYRENGNDKLFELFVLQ